MFDKSIKPPAASNNSLALALNYINTKLQFDGSCLKQQKWHLHISKLANTYIVYEINLWSSTQGADFRKFGAVKLDKNTDPNKYSHYGYDIGFDERGIFSLSGYLMVVGLVRCNKKLVTV